MKNILLLKYLTITISLVLFSTFTFAQQIVPGEIKGVFNVSDLGGASYTIPIPTPTGTADLQPSIALVYNSQGGNGIMGMGWSLKGISAITRVSNTVYNDKKVAAVRLNATDRFALDGNRLIAVQGSYGAPSSKYRTENETFSDITANGTLGTGPQSFTVTDANGLTYEYGISANSRATVSGKAEPYMWLLERVTDLSGNYIQYSYINATDHEPLLSSIGYNPRSSLPVYPYVDIIAFIYEDRPDPSFFYIGGYKLQSQKRLTRIGFSQRIMNTLDDYRTVTSYDFTYNNDFYSHLVRITQKGVNNASELPPTTFTYGNIQQPQPLSEHSEIGTGANFNYATGDYNADGKTDVIRYSTQNGGPFQLYLNTGNAANAQFSLSQSGILQNGFSSAVVENLIEYNQAQAAPFDYNGDGREDFAVFQNFTPQPNIHQQKYWIYQSSGSTVGAIPPILWHDNPSSPGNSSTFAHTMPFTGDFDGDGKSEILLLNTLQSPGNSNFLIGQEYNTYTTALGYPAYKAKNLGALPFDASYVSSGDADIRVIDFDGDGKNEILSIWANNAEVFELNVTYDANNKPVIGSPIFKKIVSGTYPTADHEIYTGDFNGDGITDVLTYKASPGWRVAYGKGDGLFGDISAIPNIQNKPRGGFYNEAMYC